MEPVPQVNIDDLNNAEANRIFWDGAATSFYEKLVALPKVVQMYDKVTATVLARTKFDPNTTSLMDFACGTGALSVALAPHCKTVVGVDISQGMVNAYNSRMESLGITNARALRAELKPDESQLLGEKFDVILCSQAYKHIDDNVAITRVLKSYLKPNGVLLVVETTHGKDAVHLVFDMHKDLHATPPSRPKNIMSHKYMGGYTEEGMRMIFKEAGLIDFTFEEAFERREGEKSYGVFVAKGACPV